MREKLNDIISFIIAAILTFLVFHIKLVPPKEKTFNLNNVVTVSTLTQAELKELAKMAKEIKLNQKYVNLGKLSKKIKRKKYKKYSYRKHKKTKYKKHKKIKKHTKPRKVHHVKKTKLAKANAYSKLKVRENKKKIKTIKKPQKKVLNKPIAFSLNGNESVNLKVPGIPISYLEILREIISSNYFYPKEAFEKNIQGEVVIKFGLNKYGKLIYAKVIKSDSDILAQAALLSIRRCKFPPFPPDLKYDEVYFIVKVKYQILHNNL